MSTIFKIFLYWGDFLERKFAVIGFPLTHTMSPYIHKELFSLSGISANYKAIEISPDELSEKTELLKSLDGFNVTIPFKQEIMPLINELAPSAKLYGAVNTVLVENNKTTGYSTDADGFYGSLLRGKAPLSGSALICGCGGAARTLAILLAEKGYFVTLGVRNTASQKAAEISAEIMRLFGKKTEILSLKQIHTPFDLIINCTPLGMYPNTEASVLEIEQIKGAKFVFDTVYNPKETLLIKYAKEQGIPCGGGMAMLVLQAVKAHEIWYGATFKEDDINALIEKADLEMGRIFENK